MGLGLSKDFILFLIISLIVWIGTENWRNAAALMAVYAVIKIVWRILTK